MIKSVTHKVSGYPITLKDLRDLVEVTKDASPDTQVNITEYKSFNHPTDRQDASLSVTITETA